MNIFNDLNKMVNTIQKVDKLLSDKPKRKRTPIKSKATFNNHLRGIIEYILLQPIEDRKNLERDVVDAINQLHYNNNY
jgi:hypothetical protein